ncbi:MAG: flavodoxin family protein [Bacillota bacterium]
MAIQHNLPRTLIVCYSLEGTTLQLAQAMATAVGADIHQIQPQKSIPKQGFGKYFLGGMQAIFRSTPALIPDSVDPSVYELVIIGGPTWGRHMASPLRSWLSKASLRGQEVAIFCSCRGDAGGTLQDMRQMLTQARVIGENTFTLNARQDNLAQLKRDAVSWARQLN